MMRFLGWYLAVILAAYAVSASWSLGTAGERLRASEQQAAQLSAELDTTNETVISLQQQAYCAGAPEVCSPAPPS
jgi:hypothetical protein